MRAMVAIGVLAIWAAAAPASAQVLPPVTLPPTLVTIQVPITVSGNTVTGAIQLPGGIGIDLTITFEKAVGLNSNSLEVFASLVNPLDPARLARLPSLLSVPVALPVVIRVQPSASSMLSFSGVYTIALHTENLSLNLLQPLSLLKSPNGGPFQDITKSEGIESSRDAGSGGDFSDFLIALDLRPIDSVIVGKFDALQNLLNASAGSLPPDVFSSLQGFLTQARNFYQAGNLQSAIAQVQAFSNFVKAHSGAEIPDVWRANCAPEDNVAGHLRSAANTLRFSLVRKAR